MGNILIDQSQFGVQHIHTNNKEQKSNIPNDAPVKLDNEYVSPDNWLNHNKDYETNYTDEEQQQVIVNAQFASNFLVAFHQNLQRSLDWTEFAAFEEELNVDDDVTENASTWAENCNVHPWLNSISSEVIFRNPIEKWWDIQ